MTIKEALKWGKELLVDSEVEGPDASVNFLLRQVLGVDRAFIIAHDEKKLTKLQELKYRRYIKKRSKHEPVWYITGKIEFMGLDLAVNTSVLIPRPETELMIEKVLTNLSSLRKRGSLDSRLRGNDGVECHRILDVGTGSGTIILALANSIVNRQSSINKRETNYQLPTTNCQFFASDISSDALIVARKNAAANGLSEKVEFREGDLFSPWQGEKFDLIVANLPYVPHEDMATLAFDLTHYEPRVALDGGVLGLEIYKKFIEQLPQHLDKGGMAYLEIGYDQGRYIADFVKKYLPKAKVKVEGDYQQIDRIVIIET